MKIMKNICHSLGNFAKGLPTIDQAYARRYGLSVFATTRYSAISRSPEHVWIKMSSQRVSGNPNFSSLSLSRIAENATTTCSKRLMRASLKEFSDRLKCTDSVLSEAKQYLENSQDSYTKIKSYVFHLNRKLFDDLKATKEQKLLKLMPRVVDSSADIKRLVICIPEDLDLPSDQRDMLSHGLRFVPTPKHVDKSEILHQMDKLYRRIKLHAFFNDQNKGFIDITPDDDDDADQFSKYNRKPSKWTPPYNPDCVDRFIDRCKEEIELVDLKVHRKESNIADSDHQALKTLKNRDDVIIKPADKGGAIVVWKKELYLKEAERQLSDKTFYKRENIDQTLHNRNVVKTTVFEEINANHLPKSASVLVLDEVRCSRFYLLPKIHKIDVPGRPVVSACSCPTELLSTYIDDLLKPIVVTLPSYLKDSAHLLRVLNNVSVDPTSKGYLFTMDVKSLHMVIPNDQGIIALKHFLNRRSSLSPPTDTIIRLSELVLTLNHFEFNDEYYTQVRGVSMGTRMGPSYACLFMGFLGQQFLEQYRGPVPDVYKRYIDGCVGYRKSWLFHIQKLWKTKLKGLLILHRKSLWFCLSTIVPLRYRKLCIKMLKFWAVILVLVIFLKIISLLLSRMNRISSKFWSVVNRSLWSCLVHFLVAARGATPVLLWCKPIN